MPGPNPATTEWVPVWSPVISGPTGPQGPQGEQGEPGTGGGTSGPHATTHLPAGSDAIPNIALKNVDNQFVRQTFTTDLIQVELKGTGHAGLLFNEVGQPVDLRKWRIIGYNQELWFDKVNEAENSQIGPVIKFLRNGHIQAAGLSTTPVADSNLSANVALRNVVNTFTQNQRINNAGGDLPRLTLIDVNQPANAKIWQILNATQSLQFWALDDTEGSIQASVSIGRNGVVNSAGFNTAGAVSAATVNVNSLTHNGLGYVNCLTGLGVNANVTVGTTLSVASTATFASALNCNYIEATAHIRSASDVYAGSYFRANSGAGYIFDNTTARSIIRDGAGTLNFNNDATVNFNLSGVTEMSVRPVPLFSTNCVGTRHQAPLNDGQWYLGNTNGFRWLGGAYVNAPVIGSDLRDTDILGEEPLGLNFINLLKPVAYRWKENKDTVRPGLRTKHGFVAQDMQETLNTLGIEFDGIEPPITPEGHWGLAYTELIAPMVKAMQEMSAQIDELRAELKALKAV